MQRISPRSSLRKLIRCKRTKAFLTKDGSWSHDIRKALIIRDPTKTDNLPRGLELQGVEIYYSFDEVSECEYDFTLALP